MGLSQAIFGVFCVASGVGLYWAMVASIRNGAWLTAALAAFVTSPTVLLVLAGTAERRSGWGLIDFSRQSWAVLIGDTFALPVAAAVVALGWRRFGDTLTQWQWSRGRGFLFVAVGVTAGVLFHWWDVTANYIPAGAGMAANSPTKLWHDLVAYPVLFGALWYGLVPIVFRHRAGWYRWVIVVCGLVWLGLVVRDTFWGHLDPSWLHPAWDVIRFRPL